MKNADLTHNTARILPQGRASVGSTPIVALNRAVLAYHRALELAANAAEERFLTQRRDEARVETG